MMELWFIHTNQMYTLNIIRSRYSYADQAISSSFINISTTSPRVLQSSYTSSSKMVLNYSSIEEIRTVILSESKLRSLRISLLKAKSLISASSLSYRIFNILVSTSLFYTLVIATLFVISFNFLAFVKWNSFQYRMCSLSI